MKNQKATLAALMLGLSSVAFSVQAADVKSSDQIKAEYNAAVELCKPMDRAEKKACEKRAEADRENARADAEVGKAEAEAKQDVEEDRRDAEYEAAKAQCDTMSGDAKDKCETEAETKFNK